jgi:hypothetical protein
MKKGIFLSVTLITIVLMSSFKSINLESTTHDDLQQENCDYLAMSNYYLDLAFGWDQEVAYDVYLQTLHDCMNNGGFSEYEITIVLE